MNKGGSTCASGPPTAAAGRRCLPLRHPGPQHEVRDILAPQRQDAGLQDPQYQRVVTVLLQELDAARKDGAAAHAELDSMKAELLQALRHKQSADAAAGMAARGGGGSSKRGCRESQPSQPSQAGAHIPAFRPPGQAPPPKPQPALPARKLGVHERPERQPAASSSPKLSQPPGTSNQAQDEQLQALKQDNEEMRGHLEALYAHCRQLQRRLDAASPAQRPASPTRRQVVAEAVTAAGAPGPGHRPCSPGRTTVVVTSPSAAGGATDLTVALFEPAPEDVGELRLALNRLQRQNLKLSSKLNKVQSELADRAAEARRWREAMEQQSGAMAELRVDVECERKRQQGLQQALAAAQGQQTAAQEDTRALLEQLQAAEATARAAGGEAASLRGQLAMAEEQLERAQAEVVRLKEEASSTSARLSATDLVRRQAERDRDDLELEAQQLRAALAEALASSSTVEEELAARLATAQQQVAVEQQRSAMLQAQLSLVEAQGRETERVLGEQLRAVQEERNVCLAAATRADALLVKLGQHALATRGIDP